jgi:DNA-binding beta-propeller fold protein YncE
MSHMEPTPSPRSTERRAHIALSRRAASLFVAVALGLLLATVSANAAPTNICSSGAGAGQCSDPAAVAVDQSNGDVYVGDINNRRVDEFEADGHFLRAFGIGVVNGAKELQTCTTLCIQGNDTTEALGINPFSLAVDPASHDLYVFNSDQSRVQKYAFDQLTEEYELLLSFGSGGVGGQFIGQEDPIAVDEEGHVWVGETERVGEFSEAGGLLSEVALANTGRISSLAVDSAHNIYAITPAEAEVQWVNPPSSGTFTLAFEGQTTTPLPFNASAAEYQEALEALPTVGSGNVLVRRHVEPNKNDVGEEVGPAFVRFEGALADRNVPQLIASAGSVETKQEGSADALRKFSPSGELLEVLDVSGHPSSVTVDPIGGNVFVSDQVIDPIHGSPPGTATLLEFDSAGAQIDAFGSGEVIGIPSRSSLAFGSAAQRLYVASNASSENESVTQAFSLPAPGPALAGGSATAKEVHKLAASLCARVDPEGAETEARFQYITAQKFEENEAAGHEGFLGAVETPESASLGEDFSFAHELCQEVSSLKPETAYRFRAIAHNANAKPEGIRGETTEFATLPAAAISSTGVAEVTSSSATLQAEVNPLGDETYYRFEYLPQAESEEDEERGESAFVGALQAPVQPAPVGAGSVAIPVSQHVQGLLSSTDYRFRAVVSNGISEANGGPVGGPVRVFVTQSAVAAGLPDARGWEQVSPSQKHGANLKPINGEDLVRAAVEGNAMTYVASFPTEGVPAGNPSGATSVLSGRSGGAWASRDLIAPHRAFVGVVLSGGSEVKTVSPDLSGSLLQPLGQFEQQISSAASEQAPFMHIDFPGGEPTAFCDASCFKPLVTGCPETGECPSAVQALADVPPGTVFGRQSALGTKERCLLCGPQVLAATPDLSHAVLNSTVALTSTALPGKGSSGLYEYSAAAPPAEALRLLSVLPDGEPSGGNPTLGALNRVIRNAISSDGSRVVFSGQGGSQLYLRVNATEQQSSVTGNSVDGSQCSEPAMACTIEIDALQGGPGASQTPLPAFQAASADGSRIFFTDPQQLTPDSGHSSQDGDLYEYDLERPVGERLADLTPPGAGAEAAAVMGLIVGASADGSSVYFVADGVLGEAPNPHGERARPGNCASSGTSTETCNLYVRHAGVTSFIATLSGADTSDWGTVGARPEFLAARVSPDGRWLVFSSRRSLTGYDNRDTVSVQPDQELYLYRAAGEGSQATLVCASCNPTGARPHGQEVGAGNLLAEARDSSGWVAANVPGWTIASYQSRYLSDSGRLFFNSSDALVPQDSNGTEDVYELEPAGVGGCSESASGYVASAGGCLGLISSGTSPEESAFLDASENGDDIFFLTKAQLVPTDADSSLDVYDARAPHVPGEAVGYSEPVKPPACEGDACQSPVAAPEDPTPGSLSFQGPGNLLPPVAASVAPKAKPLTRAQRLSGALRACRHDRPKRKRAACERQARRRYGASKAKKSTKADRRAK